LTKSGSSGWTVMRAVAATEAGKSREIGRQIAGLPEIKMADACRRSRDAFAVVEVTGMPRT